MKKILKKLIILFFTTLYCITIFFINSNSVNTSNNNDLNKDKTNYFLSVSNNLFCNTPKTETNTSNISNTYCQIKNFNNINLIVKLKEKIYKINYYLYTHKSIDSKLNLNISTIIYPFNYFW